MGRQKGVPNKTTVAVKQALQAREEPEADIDPDVDPVGALKQMRAKVQAYEAADRLDQQTDAERQTRERQLATVESALSEHETDFREDHADYDDAAKHYAVTRAQELMSFGLALWALTLRVDDAAYLNQSTISQSAPAGSTIVSGEPA